MKIVIETDSYGDIADIHKTFSTMTGLDVSLQLMDRLITFRHAYAVIPGPGGAGRWKVSFRHAWIYPWGTVRWTFRVKELKK